MKTSKLLLNIFPLLVLGGAMVYAAAPNGGYLPGVMNNPDCAPGDTDCFVQAMIDTDDQTLSLTGTSLSIQDGNSVDLAPIIPSTTQYAQTVFIDTLIPSTAMLFDTESPATLNNPALASDSNNIYIGTDGSNWVWNGTTYITKVIPDSTAWKLNNTETDAGASKIGDIWRNGKIGIGTYATNTITSSGSVRINMDSATATSNTLVLYNPNQASTAGNSIAFRALMSNGSNREMAYIRAQYIDHGDTTRSADMYFSTASGAAAQNRMIIKNNGNIGFGTITPGANFSLNGIDQSITLAALRNFPAMIDINSTNTATGAESNILFTSYYSGVNKVANASIASIKETSGTNANYGQASLVFRTSGNSIASLNTEKMRIMGNGNVGIGTDIPAYKLQVLDNVDANTGVKVQNTHSGTAAFASMSVQSDDSSGYIGAFSSTYGNGNLQDSYVIRSGSNTSSGILINAPGAFIRFSTVGSADTQMILANGGNVGIATSSPATKLDVVGSIKIAGNAYVCSTTLEGAIKYNSTTKKHQGCNGTSWFDLY